MSDNDLIRRGNVLKAVQYHVTDDDDRNTLSHAIAALPPAKQDNVAISNARGVGVPADVRDYAIDVSEAFDTMMEVERNPAGAWQAIQALAGHIAALAPTDATQAREAALEWVKKHGIHGEDCDTVTRQDDFDLGFDMETICTCGLTAILRATEGRG